MKSSERLRRKEPRQYVRPSVVFMFPEVARDVVATIAVAATVGAVVTSKVKQLSLSDHFLRGNESVIQGANS